MCQEKKKFLQNFSYKCPYCRHTLKPELFRKIPFRGVRCPKCGKAIINTF